MLNNKKTNDLYNILNKKQPKVSTSRAIPSRSLGEDGSLHISILPSGPKLFAKFKSEWFHVSLDHIKNLTKKNRSENINNLYTSLVRFLDSDKSHHTGIKAHSTTTENVDYILPASKPSSTARLKSDSSGNLSWDIAGHIPVSAIANNRILGNVSGSSAVSTALTGSEVTALLDSASSSAAGKVELATTAETTTGTDTARAVTPDGLKDGYEGSANVVTTGALDSGSITSGFGNINNGSSTTQTGALTAKSGTITSGTLSTAGSDDYSIKSTQTLNDGSAAGGTQEYAQIKTYLTATDGAGWDKVYLTHQVVDGASKFRVNSVGDVISAGTVTSSNGVSGRFNVSGDQIAYRMSSVNTYYIGNRSLSTSVTNADFTYVVHQYAQYTSNSGVKLQEWRYTGSFSSSVDYEVEMWEVVPDEGSGVASLCNKVGDTQSVSATAQAFHTIKDDNLDYTLTGGHQLYMIIRYTSGSGNKYTYGTCSMEFTNG